MVSAGRPGGTGCLRPPVASAVYSAAPAVPGRNNLCGMDEAVIYTDGACRGNPGPGGWGVVLRYGTAVKELHGGEPVTTNNRMELMAAISALEALTRPAPVTLYTDSRYVLDGVTKWLPGWQRNGWRTAGRQPVKNLDLWQHLVKAMAPHEITWRLVKGHKGG